MREQLWNVIEHQRERFTISWETEEAIFYVWYVDGRVDCVLNRIGKSDRPGRQTMLDSEIRTRLQETIEMLPKHLFVEARRARRYLEEREDRVREERTRSHNEMVLRRMAEQHGYELHEKAS